MLNEVLVFEPQVKSLDASNEDRKDHNHETKLALSRDELGGEDVLLCLREDLEVPPAFRAENLLGPKNLGCSAVGMRFVVIALAGSNELRVDP